MYSLKRIFFRKQFKEDVDRVYRAHKSYSATAKKLEDMLVTNDKVYVIHTETVDELNKAYNKFLAEVKEVENLEYEDDNLGFMKIKSSSEVTNTNGTYMVTIKYIKVELKSGYTRREYYELLKEVKDKEDLFYEYGFEFQAKYHTTYQMCLNFRGL